MYPIDLDTCTAIDVIKRSATCHPSLFIDALVSSKNEDFAYAAKLDRNREAMVTRSVLARANATANAISAIEIEDFEFFKVNMGAGIIAMNIACKLQVIPAHIRTAIATRTW